MKRTRKTKRGYNSQTNAKSASYRGQRFKSGLEKTMAQLLDDSDIPFSYEQRKFTIIKGEMFNNDSYEKQLNGKGDFINRGNKRVTSATYTPDFTNREPEELKWVIETKGRAMPDFSRTWKLFKNLISKEYGNITLFVPRTKKDCEKVIQILKKEFYD